MKLAWHMYHNSLLSVVIEPIENRIKYIKENKPESEVSIRLRLLKPVKGKLPVAYVKATEAYVKAREAYGKTWEAYDKAGEACKPEIEALHAIECPNCPWDGETIFPKLTERKE